MDHRHGKTFLLQVVQLLLLQSLIDQIAINKTEHQKTSHLFWWFKEHTLNLNSWWIILIVRATCIRQQQTTPLYHAVNYSLINPITTLLLIRTYLIYFRYVNWGMVLIIGKNFFSTIYSLISSFSNFLAFS